MRPKPSYLTRCLKANSILLQIYNPLLHRPMHHSKARLCHIRSLNSKIDRTQVRILKIKHWPLFRISNINLQSLQMTLHQFLLEPSPKTLLSMVYKPGLGMLAYYTPIVVKLAICIKIVLPSLFCHRSKLSFVLCFRRLYTRQIVQGLRSHLY
jgi:hypothetical protein